MKRSMIVGAGFILFMATVYVWTLIQGQPEQPDPFAQ